MGKARNRNAERVKKGMQPKPNVSGRSANKPFIGNNVFTMEDQAIIEQVVHDNPEGWTLQSIKDALPYAHTMKTIANYMLRMFPQHVIDQHAALPQQPAEDETPVSETTDFASEELDRCVRELYPAFGPEYPRWKSLARNHFGITASRADIIARAKELGVTYEGDTWTSTEDELLLECRERFENDGEPEDYIYDWFETPRSKYAVMQHLRAIAPQAKKQKAPAKPKAYAGTTRKENDTMPNENQKPVTTHDAEKDRQAFLDLSNLLMNLSPHVTIHVDIKFPDGMNIRFDREGKERG